MVRSSVGTTVRRPRGDTLTKNRPKPWGKEEREGERWGKKNPLCNRSFIPPSLSLLELLPNQESGLVGFELFGNFGYSWLTQIPKEA